MTNRRRQPGFLTSHSEAAPPACTPLAAYALMVRVAMASDQAARQEKNGIGMATSSCICEFTRM